MPKKKQSTNSSVTVTINPYIKYSTKKKIIEPTIAEKLPLDIMILEEHIKNINPSNSLNLEEIIQNVKNAKSLFNSYSNALNNKEEMKPTLEWISAYITNLDIFSLLSFLYVCESVNTKPYNEEKIIAENEKYTFKNVIADMINDKIMDFKMALDMKTFSLALADEKPKVSRIFWVEDEYIRKLIKQSLNLYKAIFKCTLDVM